MDKKFRKSVALALYTYSQVFECSERRDKGMKAPELPQTFPNNIGRGSPPTPGHYPRWKLNATVIIFYR